MLNKNEYVKECNPVGVKFHGGSHLIPATRPVDIVSTYVVLDKISF